MTHHPIPQPTADTSRPASQLLTFRPPKPSKAMIRALGPVNRWLMLGGIPGLRRLPGLRAVPGMRGLMNVPEIDFPEVEQQRLRSHVNENTAAFLTPNHPEFFTDWMLDKYVLNTAAPLAASWATHFIVNGLGRTMQKFWLKNNLIAQIPGVGGQAGKDYSVSWARKGHGVLLHPEGSVGWHSDCIGPLFPGAAEMACETARHIKAAGETRDVYLAPVVWKLYFLHDVSADLGREIAYIERRLRLPKSDPKSDPAVRLYAVYDALLARDEVKWQAQPTDDAYFDRLQRLRDQLCIQLRDRLDRAGAAPADSDQIRDQVRRGVRWLRGQPKTATGIDVTKALTKDLGRLVRFQKSFYPNATMTQEHVAECLKRVRNDYCRGGMRDTIHNYIPQPVGARRAVIRVPKPVRVHSENANPQTLTDVLRDRMQDCLDQINVAQSARQKDQPVYPNSFQSG